ncbi:SURF1 family protein [Microbacterium sp.]|uniref:SURF1 family cytochrome oxidase biogenesis protein n=1 Tax=Microbacterium sp. TaxID=51671 RepID=UPI0037CA52D0
MSRRQTAPAAVRWTAYIGIAVVFAIACAFLSNWQFTRNADRSQQLALVAANYDADPVALSTLIPAGAALDPADEWRPVELTGTYLSDQQLLVRNRAHGGTAAFEVLVPLELSDGRLLLVDRGWVGPGSSAEEPEAVPPAPTGEVTVVVRLRDGEALPASGRGAPPGQVPTINLPLIAEQLGADRLETSAYGLMVSEDPAPADRPAPLPSPSDDPGPYLSYAIQWILFAIMGFVFIAYVIVTERRHRREEAEDAAAAATRAADGEAPASPPRQRRTGRRRDRDMQEEDAVLDEVGR